MYVLMVSVKVTCQLTSLNNVLAHQSRQDVLNDLLPRHFFDAVIAEKINIAGRPTFAIETFEPGKDLSFTATFEVYPEVELKDLENIKVEKPTVEITEADIDKMIDVLRKQQATWAESKAAAKADSRVTIDSLVQ